jgi:hypothetical protein
MSASTAPDITAAMAPDAEPAPGITVVAGKSYMTDARGSLVPVETVKTTDKLMDELVRKIMGYAEPLAAEIGRFKAHTFDDVDSFVSLLAQEYGTSIGGTKGNITLTRYDGLAKVQVAVADLVEFGPELQVAKTLVDECLSEWSADSGPELRAIVQRAFNVDKAGKINRAELLSLTRLDIDDERWKRAMQAIRDAQRTIGSQRYVRIYERPSTAAPWRMVSLDLATA